MYRRNQFSKKCKISIFQKYRGDKMALYATLNENNHICIYPDNEDFFFRSTENGISIRNPFIELYVFRY